MFMLEGEEMKTTIEMAIQTLDRMAPDDYCREAYWTATDKELDDFANLVRIDECNLGLAETEAMERQVNILTDALAESRREIDALVALARVDEREACAKLCDELRSPHGWSAESALWVEGTNNCADAIRARSNT
jgi:hypothetical protein